MSSRTCSRALRIYVGADLLAGCDGSQPPIGAQGRDAAKPTG